VFLQKSVHHLIGSSRAHDRENHHTLQHFYQHRNFLCDVNSLLRILEMFANCVRSPTVYTSHGRRRPTKIKLLFGCLIPFVYLKRTILQGPLQNPKQNANASAASQRRRRRAVPDFDPSLCQFQRSVFDHYTLLADEQHVAVGFVPFFTLFANGQHPEAKLRPARTFRRSR